MLDTGQSRVIQACGYSLHSTKCTNTRRLPVSLCTRFEDSKKELKRLEDGLRPLRQYPRDRLKFDSLQACFVFQSIDQSINQSFI